MAVYVSFGPAFAYASQGKLQLLHEMLVCIRRFGGKSSVCLISESSGFYYGDCEQS